MPHPSTLGELRSAGYAPRSVKQELQVNALERIGAGLPVIDGLVGYDTTVLPQVEHALLAQHDIVLLGERGQAKTRLIRSLIALLDEWVPVVSGSEINDDPLQPISKYAKELIEAQGDATPIEWLHRSRRYGEKLATPDTSIADLIGEVDPIKVAEGRYLSDELTLHYGLVPRTHRGIFAINELPDLAERIQVGLLNVLEERDVQVRGYSVRLPLDLLVVATANPEDYTNRGRLITPLKDRFGSQIRTHYPLSVEDELVIVREEAVVDLPEGVSCRVLPVMEEVIGVISQLARASRAISQRSGVSVRMSVTNFELMLASGLRRATRAGETVVSPRICDLNALAASMSGKIEIDSFDDAREGQILEGLVRSAVLVVFRDHVDMGISNEVLTDLEELPLIEAGDDIEAAQLADLVGTSTALASLCERWDARTIEERAAVVEFVLEGLHLDNRLNKESVAARAQYRRR